MWDERNQLEDLTDGSDVTEFFYDADGNRVKRSRPDGTHTVYVGAWYEYEDDDTPTHYYTFGGQRIALRYNGALEYLFADHLGSSSVTYDGATTKTQRYYPWGNIRTSGNLDTDVGFTGQRLDQTTGLMHYQARYYDPNIGRFISPDTIVPHPRDPQLYNRYSYVQNRPTAMKDPTGNCGLRSGPDGGIYEDNTGCVFANSDRHGNPRGSGRITTTRTAFDEFADALWSYWVQADRQWVPFLETAALGISNVHLGDLPWPIARNLQNRFPGEDRTIRLQGLSQSAVIGDSGWRLDLIDGDESPAAHFFGFFAIAAYHPALVAAEGLERNEAVGRAGSSLQDLNSGYAAIALAIVWTRLGAPSDDAEFNNFIDDLYALAGDPSRVFELATSFNTTRIPVSTRPAAEKIISEQVGYLAGRHPELFGG